MSEIEIYLLGPARPALGGWLASRLGDIQVVDRDEDIQMLRAKNGARVTVTPGVEEGPFTSVLITGVGLPWVESQECCRDAAQAMEVVTRCAPPDQHHRDVWIQIDGAEETLVTWDTPPHISPGTSPPDPAR